MPLFLRDSPDDDTEPKLSFRVPQRPHHSISLPPRNSLACKLIEVRREYGDWTYSGTRWGGENHWGDGFTEELSNAIKEGWESAEAYRFFEALDKHGKRGQKLLNDLKIGGTMSEEVRSNARVVEDLFRQAFDLGMKILAEVKFVDCKLDEYTPVITPMARNSYRDFKDHSEHNVDDSIIDLT